MSVLVTGGAGYIGGHVVTRLRERGDAVVVVDNLSSGLLSRIGDVPHVNIDLSSSAAVTALRDVIRDYQVESVIHFAAKKSVSESAEIPLFYFEQNIVGLLNLLEALNDTAVSRFVFSSSAAVYGDARGLVLEDAPTTPTSPYGDTKLMGETILNRVSAASAMKVASLRYFNVAGAASPALADTSVANLVPMVFERIREGQPPFIFGDDYDTPDGTCVRDYVHVVDLAEAHLAALDYLAGTQQVSSVFNIGTGRGYSVKEVIDVVRAKTGFDPEPIVAPRRAGDPAKIVADVTRARDVLKWEARLGLDEMVSSAWEAS
jgi:UDP-glucose 4-epimerase